MTAPQVVAVAAALLAVLLMLVRRNGWRAFYWHRRPADRAFEVEVLGARYARAGSLAVASVGPWVVYRRVGQRRLWAIERNVRL